jgi:hypothetical protein
MKWVAAAALAFLLVLIFLWRQLDEPAQAVAAKPKAAETTALVKTAPSVEAAMAATAAKEKAEQEAKKPGEPEVMDAGSELFTKSFIDVIPKRLWKEASVCYEGKLGSRHRNSKIKYSFNIVVKNGKASVQDFKPAIDEDTGKPVNSINDPAIESCFVQKLSNYSWDQNADMPEGYTMPDYVWPDTLVIRPERSKKYYKDNVEYVGGEAPNLPGRLAPK